MKDTAKNKSHDLFSRFLRTLYVNKNVVCIQGAFVNMINFKKQIDKI